MTEATTPLAEDFGPQGDDATRARWMALVEKTLKGQSFDQSLTAATPDGLTIQPLYTAKDGVAVARDLRLRDAERPWDLRVPEALSSSTIHRFLGNALCLPMAGAVLSVVLAVNQDRLS